MSERDRLFHPVTGCLAGVFLLLVGPSLLGVQQNEPNEADSYSEQYVSYPVDPATPVDSDHDQRSAEERDEADVRAQERMADAADAAVNISFFGLLGLGATVLFAYLAWEAASSSAKADNEALELTRKQLDRAIAEAEQAEGRAASQLAALQDSANAGWAAAATAERIGKAQVRAYVNVDNFRMIFDRGSPRLVVSLMNNGQSPALNVLSHLASAEFFFKDSDGTVVERLSCSMQSNMRFTAPDIQARKPGTAACDFSMNHDLAQRFAERCRRYDYSINAAVIVSVDDVFEATTELVVRGQKTVKAGTMQVVMDILGAGGSGRAFTVHENETRTRWTLPMTPGAVMPEPLPPLPPPEEPKGQERI